MISRRRSALVIAAGLSALALASCGQKPQTAAAKDTVVFSILSTENTIVSLGAGAAAFFSAHPARARAAARPRPTVK